MREGLVVPHSPKLTFSFLPKFARKEMWYQQTAKQTSDSNKARLTGKIKPKPLTSHTFYWLAIFLRLARRFRWTSAYPTSVPSQHWIRSDHTVGTGEEGGSLPASEPLPWALFWCSHLCWGSGYPTYRHTYTFISSADTSDSMSQWWSNEGNTMTLVVRRNNLLKQLTCSKKNKELPTKKDGIPFGYAHISILFQNRRTFLK